MTQRKRKARWSKMIEESGIKVRLYERPNGASVHYSFHMDGKKIQRSTKKSDRKEAEDYARQVVRLVVEDRLLGRRGPVSLGEVFRAYRRHRAPLLTASWRQAAETRVELFLQAWGPELRVDDVGQTHVDRYTQLRTSGKLAPRHTRSQKAVRAGTVDAEFRWLSSVFNWAHRYKTDGRRLLQANPLHDVEWPREKNPRRPVASHQRFTATLLHVDTVDPEGRLACMLALARYTGRRESAICHLRVSDLLLTPEAIRAALAAQGMDERQADHMPNGAVRWRDEHDKQGYSTIAPISQAARKAVDAYLQTSRRVGDAWAFPSPKDDSKPIRRDLAARWLIKAEKLAQLPKLTGGVWHPYRRAWATDRKHLPDADVAAAGGWRDTRALKSSYQQADPATTLRVVEEGA